jgi:predicted metallo-beta-lactamase superfamily hydrolase
MDIKFTPVWFDSLGAKSACTLVKTPDITILIDPGVSVMHRGFPASVQDKQDWEVRGEKAIKKACEKANIIIISHYHYDHFFPDDMKLYSGKLLLTKNPNEYINRSQRKRAEEFFHNICRYFGKTKLTKTYQKSSKKEFSNPLDELPLAMGTDFGDYNDRRKQLLGKGLQMFKHSTKKWNKSLKIPELKFKDIEVKYPEDQRFEFGKTTIKFSKPLFHGLEFSDVGWIFATVIEYENRKVIHTSDINGPVIEDYADWIVRENPDILIVDGPLTYMFGYLVNKTNLDRAIKNMTKIVYETNTELIIYDHHLPREPNFKNNTKLVWAAADEVGKKLMTAAEFLGKTPVVLRGT